MSGLSGPTDAAAGAAAGAGLFDAFLRSGCIEPQSGAVPAPLASLPALASARTWGAMETFAGLMPEILGGSASFVLFAERGVQVSEGSWRLLVRLLRNNPGIPALTFDCDALPCVYGPAAAGEARDEGRVPQRLTPIRHLPSWFAVVNRAWLAEAAVAGAGFQSLEYFLLDLCRRWAARSARPLRLDSAAIVLDSRSWARQLLRHAAGQLAADYATWRARYGDAAPPPPQLRVEVRGERIPHPGRPDLRGIGMMASGRPKISLLCPVWKPDFLEEMLRSVIAQTWPAWELLLLVDGPPAAEERRILEILARVASEPRIRFRCWLNRGTGICRQSLAAEADGDFLLSIDDDDLLPAHALEVLAGAVRLHPDVQCFRGGTQLIGLEERYLPPRRRLVVGGISNDPFEVSQPFLVARDLLSAVGGFAGDPALHHAGEDTDLFHKLDRAGVRTLIVDEPLYLRRLSRGNLSLGFGRQQVLDHFRHLEERFCPPGWQVVDRQNELDDGFQHAVVTYRGGDGAEVVTATRFFQYKTLGSESLAAIDLEVTSVCNATCSFCPREAMPDKRSFIELGVVEALAGQLANEPGQRQVILCGIGESTLHPELATIVELLARAGARVCMTTNGSRLDSELFQRLVGRGLKELNVSLNAATADTHWQVMRLRDFAGIKQRLLEILDCRQRLDPQVKVHVSFVLCDQNQHELEDFVEEWRPRPVSQIWIHPLNNRAGLLNPAVRPVDVAPLAERYGSDERVIVDIFKHHPEHGNTCKIVRSLDFISVDGELRLCAMDYARLTRYGNVRRNLLRHLYLEKMLSYRRGETLSLCAGCDFHPRSAATP
jgi:MoaA/NifB/PqqE/SkfB family radical SAM enzyme/glycosyltransferase involved in cell wall biosynthesis